MRAVDLGLVGDAFRAAVDFEAAFPSVVFTSGKRTLEAQANAMAQNCMLASDFIRRTYVSSPLILRLAEWTEGLTRPTTKTALYAGILAILKAAAPIELARLSRHLIAEAFDCEPATVSASARAWLIARAAQCGGRVIFKEAGIERVHWQAA